MSTAAGTAHVENNGGHETQGTGYTHWRRLLRSPISVSGFSFSSGGIAAAHNYFLAGKGLPDQDHTNGLFIIPFGQARKNQILMEFWGTTAAALFGLRIWGARWDEGASGWTRRIRLEAALSVGSVTCPIEVSGVAGSGWVDTYSTLTSYAPVPTPSIVSAPAGGIPMQVLLDPLGDSHLIGELAKNGGSATSFNGRYATI